ncbi:MAG: (1-_4)-alpha-D-glucan 1-alpha-D-glucosylmutase [Acidobacteriota bacterium]|nr:(1->4)-alpha-D-glucan 1-alpha-D-glucosylmutase [Acidobacteriota bacterium]
MQARIPVSTYRLQFNRDFTFEQAHSLVDYFRELGVTDYYSSPVLKARPGSQHGYDIVDHTQVNPEVGTEEQLVELARTLRERGMGILVDVVPNHMCIAGSENLWWQDVLENGPGSPYARYFDIDWNPPNQTLKNRVLLPILGDQLGRVLERQELRAAYRDGAFYLNYWETQLPLAARTTTLVLRLALEGARTRLDESHAHALELESIITALEHLPQRTESDPARLRERQREKDVVRRRLSNLVKESNEVRAAVHDALARVNGKKGRPESFDLLEELISGQAYRLSFWRVAADEINYRRFFDINELAAVRVEERPVFNSVHDLLLRLVRQGLVTGLRVDHVDGLFDPFKYLSDLQREATAAAARRTRKEATTLPPSQQQGDSSGALQQGDSSGEGVERVEGSDSEGRSEGHDGEGRGAAAGATSFYVVVEKILGHDELLRREWLVEGTTGYEFMNLLNGVFVDASNAQALRELYAEFTGARVRFSDLVYECKRLILKAAMSSELYVLSRRLTRIAERHRYTRDFTQNSLHHALTEVIACFPVYRSYIRRTQTSVGPDDRLNINASVRAAKRRNPAQDPSIFDFIAALLMLRDPKGTTPQERAERRDFVLRFQQLTSPITAKGVEDTAFYRFFPLASLNEVGGEPALIGVSVERFHERNRDRQQSWPHALSATSTHDTKRGEDTRARINVLSEMPEEWNRAVHRWREMNRAKKALVEGAEVPDANEEYLLYQTLVGTWPLSSDGDGGEYAGDGEYTRRVEEYMQKALKEAKLHTSWINQNEEYERSVRGFVNALLDPALSGDFLRDFDEFQRITARCGVLNSLSQTLLKTTAPGVPDFFQGTELWSFTLVDPDNRGPVDYELRRSLLSTLRDACEGDVTEFAARLLEQPEDGRIKMYVTARSLGIRRERAELFARGAYLPLTAEGRRAENIVAFAREFEDDACIILASRFFSRLGVGREGRLRLCADAWGDTRLPLAGLGGGRYRDAFTGREFKALEDGALKLADVLSPLPVALLARVEE